MKLFGRKDLSELQERAVQKALQNVEAQRRSRFRILACVKDFETGFGAVRTASYLAPGDDCDIIVLNVRPIDQDLWSGGLQLRLARQNMLEAGLELPGLKFLKKSLDVLKEEGIDTSDWERKTGHRDAWGDPAGDNKVIFRSKEGRDVVLKLKTAPDPAAGILDQYELGPYNLIVMGEPSSWRGEVKSIFSSGVAQRVSVFSPCSVMIARSPKNRKGFFICATGTARSMQAVRRAAVLAHVLGEPITLFSVAENKTEEQNAKKNVEAAKNLLNAIGIAVHKAEYVVDDPTTAILAKGNSHRVIVVSDEGRGRMSRFFRPSVSYAVIKGATTSVLDVK